MARAGYGLLLRIYNTIQAIDLTAYKARKGAVATAA